MLFEPIRNTSLRSILLCLPLAAAGVLIAVVGAEAYYAEYSRFLVRNMAVRHLFEQEGMDGLAETLVTAWTIVAVLMASAACFGILFRSRAVLRILRISCVGYYLLFFLYAYAVRRAVSLIFGHEVPVGGEKLESTQAFYMSWDLLWPYALLAALIAIIHVQLWCRATINLYTEEEETAPARGDEIIENTRTHGDDPRYRKSIFSSSFAHLMVIVILPWLLSLVGCVRDYRVPKGRGNPVVALVQVVKPKKKKKKKKLILNPNSAIYFHQPELEDSKILKEVVQETELTYRADPNARSGKMGAGGKGPGGWPDGMDDAEIRFIRLKYNGSQWDDGMANYARADMNFLDEFHKLTGFKIAKHPEAHAIRLLSRYRKGYAPPFVYMTGNRSIRVSDSEVKVLREYLQGGGMLFADCGGPSWHRAFEGLCRRVFPSRRLEVISDDDPLFKMPFEFDEGAPPLWHHGGYRALGLKHRGRWCVFYHPGDLNDAWKTGSSGLPKRKARHAIQMGINVLYYSFTHYLEMTRKYRKG